jgi:hypothetical protein
MRKDEDAWSSKDRRLCSWWVFYLLYCSYRNQQLLVPVLPVPVRTLLVLTSALHAWEEGVKA